MKDMVHPKVSTDLPSRGKDEASPPTYPPGIIHRIRGGARTTTPNQGSASDINRKVSTDLSSKGKDEASPRTYPKGSQTKYAKPSSSSNTPYDPGTTTSKKGPKEIQPALVKPSAWSTPLGESTKVSQSTYGEPSGTSSGGKDENFIRADDTTE